MYFTAEKFKMRWRFSAIFIFMACLFAITSAGCGLRGNEEREAYGVATCSVAICEILDVLDYEDVVGIPTTESTIPSRYKDVKQIGAPMEPQIEVLKQIDPKVVLVPKTLKSSLDSQFKAAKINVEYLDLSSVEKMYEDILKIGKLIGKDEAAQTLYDEYLNYTLDYPKPTNAPAVMTVMAFSSVYTIASEDSYVGNLVKMAGGKNVYPGSYVTDGTGMVTNYSLEELVQKDPDVIIVYAHFDEDNAFNYIKELMKSDVVWKNFKAVKNDSVYFMSTKDGFGVSANLNWRNAMDALKPVFYGK